MPSKHNAGGCGCCCRPILERVDEFSSQWKCWKGGALVTSYGFAALPSTFEFDTTNGKLRKNAINGNPNDEWIAAEADLLQLPFSMEFIIEIDSWLAGFGGGMRAPLVAHVGARFSTNETVRALVEYSPAVGVGDGSLTAELRFNNSTNLGTTLATVPRNTGAFKVQYRIQYTSTGVTHWLWSNDTLLTERAPSTALWGVEESLSLSGQTELDGSYWQFGANYNAALPTADDLWVADRLELYKWDHVETFRPTP